MSVAFSPSGQCFRASDARFEVYSSAVEALAVRGASALGGSDVEIVGAGFVAPALPGAVCAFELQTDELQPLGAPRVVTPLEALDATRVRCPTPGGGVVGTWRARWSLEGTVPGDAAAVTVFARDGSEAEDPELRDPVLDVGAPLRCDCGGATGTATPDGPATLAFAGLAALPFPAALRCTYLDERVFILRDAEDAVIVLERSA